MKADEERGETHVHHPIRAIAQRHRPPGQLTDGSCQSTAAPPIGGMFGWATGAWPNVCEGLSSVGVALSVAPDIRRLRSGHP